MHKNSHKHTALHCRTTAQFLLYALILIIPVIYVAAGCTRVDSSGITAHYDIPYIDDGIDKHRLDLFLPQHPAKGFPMLVFIHGGGWHWGDRKARIDVYGDIGRSWARGGVGVAVISYRLGDDYPIEVQLSDVAAAIAWTWRHTGNYKGDPERFFVCGHSAGAHMAAMAALDPRWLAGQGLTPDILHGAILWSGLYDVPDAIERAGALGKHNIWYPIFGKDPEKWADMSPLNHLDPEHADTNQKFLIVTAEDDLDVAEEQSDKLYSEMLADGYRARRAVLEGESHYLEVFTADNPKNQMFQEVISFTGGKDLDH